MGELWQFVEQHGYLLIFLVVLAEQAGAPLPAMPVMIAVGALAKMGHYSLWTALFIAVVASLLADGFWYTLGRTRGDSVLRLLCRISLEPDSCVRHTRLVFGKWGLGTLVFAKFVPGLSTVAPPMAGVTGMSWWRFIACDGTGAALWAGSSLAAGLLFRKQAEWLLSQAREFGGIVLLVLAVPMVAYVAWKYRKRREYIALLRTARIRPEDLHAQISAGANPVVVDLRHPGEVDRVGKRLPGALQLRPGELELWKTDLPRDQDLVFYCS